MLSGVGRERDGREEACSLDRTLALSSSRGSTAEWLKDRASGPHSQRRGEERVRAEPEGVSGEGDRGGHRCGHREHSFFLSCYNSCDFQMDRNGDSFLESKFTSDNVKGKEHFSR